MSYQLHLCKRAKCSIRPGWQHDAMFRLPRNGSAGWLAKGFQLHRWERAGIRTSSELHSLELHGPVSFSCSSLGLSKPDMRTVKDGQTSHYVTEGTRETGRRREGKNVTLGRGDSWCAQTQRSGCMRTSTRGPESQPHPKGLG
eukprot:189429-Chlamydomonas_euryale.AAC.5